MKNIKLSLACCALFGSMTLSGLELSKGWNLVSYPSGELSTASIVDTNIKSIWGYDTNWTAYSNDEQYYQLMQSKNIPILETLKPSMGVWIQTISDTTLNTSLGSLINDINITKGWNLVGTIEDNTTLSQIDQSAIYWKYNNGWYLGSNKVYSGIGQFSNISNTDGVWIYSAKDHIYKEDDRKKFLFLDENLIPQEVEFEGQSSGLDGVVHNDFKTGNLLSVSKEGFKAIENIGFEGDELVSEYASGDQENYALFLETSNQKAFTEDSNDSIDATDFSLDDYFKDFYPIKFIAIEAKPIKPALLGSGVTMVMSNVNMNQSLTISFDKIDTAPSGLDNIGTFISGVDVTVQNSQKQIVDPETVNGQMNLKPIFNNITSVTNPYIFALSGTQWELVGPALYKNSKAYSKNWFNKFTKYILVDVDSANLYSHTNIVKNKKGQLLNDVLVVSDNKIAVATNHEGNFTYSAPMKPAKLIAYKQGYKPQYIDMNATSSIVLDDLILADTISGVNSVYDNNFSIIYTIGKKGKEFTYKSEDFTIKPSLIADTNKTIYSAVYPYNGGYVFGASDSHIVKLDTNGTYTKLREGDGLVYDGLVVENNDTIYYGTLGDNFVKLNTTEAVLSESDNFGYELDLAVVYKPLVSNNKIYIPTYNQDSNISASLVINSLDNIQTAIISNVGTPGKLTSTTTDVVFGTSDSKIVFVDKTSNSVSKTIEFEGSGILAAPVLNATDMFVVDLNGLLKKYTNGVEIDSIQLTPASNIVLNGDKIVVADLNGVVYYLDADLALIDFDTFDSGVIAEPIVYNGSIYIITEQGILYKDGSIIGTFNSKVTNMNLVNDSILFGCKNGTVWEIKL